MRVPFYHRYGHGLSITSGYVRWAVLRRSGRTGIEVQRVLSESVESGVEAAIKELAERVQPTPPVVATHLDPSHVRFFIVEVPHREQQHSSSLAEEEKRLIREEVVRQLPASADLNRFYICSRVLPRASTSRGQGSARRYESEAMDRRLVAVARRETAEERIRLLETAGLTPAVIGDVRADLGYAFAFDQRFTDGNAHALLFHNARAWILAHTEGELSQLPRSSSGPTPTGAVEDIVLTAAEGEIPSRSNISGAPAPMLLAAGEKAKEALNSSAEKTASSEAAKMVKPGLPAIETSGQVNLTPAHTPAVALAVRQLFGRGDELTFLDPAQEAKAGHEEEKSDALRVILASGGSLAAALATIALLSALLSWQLGKSEAALRELGAQTETIDMRRKERDDLRMRLEKSQALVEKRTRAAPFLETIGAAVPPGVWLRSINTLPAEKERSETYVAGLALREQGVTKFLSALEKADGLENVRLSRLEIVPVSQIVEEETASELASSSERPRLKTLNRFSIDIKWVRR